MGVRRDAALGLGLTLAPTMQLNSLHNAIHPTSTPPSLRVVAAVFEPPNLSPIVVEGIRPNDTCVDCVFVRQIGGAVVMCMDVCVCVCLRVCMCAGCMCVCVFSV